MIVFHPKFFPTLMIILSALAALNYLLAKDTKMTVYWIAATIINFSVTWL